MHIVFWGKVKKGAQRGKNLGYPTANIALHKKISEGVYVAIVKIDGEEFLSATFIGSAKTFGEKDYKAESYLLDFNKNIYGKWITIRLLKKIRDNLKFADKNALIAQMKNDVAEVRKYFKII